MAVNAAILAVAAVGTGTSINQQNRAQKKVRRSEDLGRAQKEAENQRSIRQAVALARVQRAQTIAAGVSQGAGDSSGLAGGTGAQRTQLGANVGFANQVAGVNAEQNRLIGSSNRDLNRGATFQAFGNLPTRFGADLGKSAGKIAERFGIV